MDPTTAFVIATLMMLLKAQLSEFDKKKARSQR